MAAGEDQPQPVVLDALVVRRSGSTSIGIELLSDRPLRSIKPRAPPQRVDGSESTVEMSHVRGSAGTPSGDELVVAIFCFTGGN